MQRHGFPAHGWWIRFSGPARWAWVTVQIQQRVHGGFVSVGTRGRTRVKPRNRGGRRVTARGRCHHYRGRTYYYRSLVDVDIIGHKDTPEKLYTPIVSSPCSVLGRDT
jgi:hypothetical protein